MLAAWGASPARFREDANAEEDLVLGGYRDRVIVELAQNAADAASRAGLRAKLRLSLDGDVLRAANTGAPLDAAGVESASTLRASSKRDDVEIGAVGRFGVGFAAVLGISDEPAIVSRTGSVQWSRLRSRGDIGEIPALHEELLRRGDAIPVLRLPYADESDRRPPEGYDTEVVVPLRDGAAVALTRELLAGVDAALLLTLPALDCVEIIVDGEVRRLVAEPTNDGVVVDGVRWKLHTVAGRLAPELLRDRPVEEQGRRGFTLSWAVPVDADGAPMSLPASVPAVAHAPTPTDEPLDLRALLIAPLPLDPTRRHVATGPLRDFLIQRAAEGYGELVRELPVVPQVLSLVPVGVAAGALDGQLRAQLVTVLRDLPFLPSPDDGVRLRPSQAVVLDDAAAATHEELVRVLREVLPNLLPAAWARGHSSELAALGVRRIALVALIDELGSLDRPPAWWQALYAALDDARVAPDLLAGLPVPLASGGVARSPRGLLMPGVVGDLSVLGLRSVDPGAAHPLLLRLGALEADPAVILAGERVRAAVENSYDAEDPEAIAEAVLRLVAACGVSVVEHPWLAELALPGADGELVVAGELLLPQGKLIELVADDSPFGVVDPRLLERWGADVLKAVGVLDSFAVVRAHDVADPEHDLDREGDYLDTIATLLDSDEPAVVEELVAVRDLEFVRDDAWPAALRLLAAPPLRDAVVEYANASTSTKRARVPAYAAWWLREHDVVSGRLAASDPLLAGLYDLVSVDLDEEFLLAVGALRDLADADPDDVLRRLADPARALSRDQVRALYTRVVPARPPAAVRVVRVGELVVVPADDAVVVDHPDLLPLLGNFGVVPVAVRDAEAVADALDIALASELGEFGVVSSGAARGDHVVHSPLMVADVEGTPTRVPWRFADGVLHVDETAYAFGVGRGRAWRSGQWARRYLETELVRDPASAAALLAEADLDSPP